MIKQVNGFINKMKKDGVSIVTSVYNGEDTNKEIQSNIINSLENFGFSKIDSKNEQWMQYRIKVNGNNEEEVDSLIEVSERKERNRITLHKNNDKITVLDITSLKTNETKHIMDFEEQDVSFYGFVNVIKDDEEEIKAIGLNTSVKVDTEESDNFISYLTSLGYKEGNSNNEEFKNFTFWVNRPSDYEKELVSSIENGRFKYTVVIHNFKDSSVNKIASLKNIEEIEVNVDKEKASEIEEEAEF